MPSAGNARVQELRGFDERAGLRICFGDRQRPQRWTPSHGCQIKPGAAEQSAEMQVLGRQS
jgi:hypothetical protein